MTKQLEPITAGQLTAITNKLLVEKIGHTALITINNPSANTWDSESLLGLKTIVELLNQDRSIYSLVITGQGEKFFSAGADLKLFAEGDKAKARDIAKHFADAFETLSQYQGVSIAAINGYAMGGGLECALACDLRIVESHSVLALPEASVGLLPCAGGTQQLPWLVGEGWAKRMILCGERVTAEKAVEIGLAEQQVESGKARATALLLAESVAKQSPSSVQACKKLIQKARFHPMWQALPVERELFIDLFNTEDQQEGVGAFLEKRPPVWKNR
ncbi:enoyl-CoA hydratase [Spartinivicinus poritis]|uniref:Enoyl-CoA hydratase n=1 Tax=Spartinivicinus poritis TaxID=2994640 RepID=A0ABT5U2K7_9GAMM|nr:enoyl-CoA hydratase [Spartinivicinus sp. A2-2]MDE1460455.1 enoyl-CoA hydratase [Spartinivicinus sp. A2-2]